jgi:N-acetylmuramoyl-L-alanine amidase CwlA
MEDLTQFLDTVQKDEHSKAYIISTIKLIQKNAYNQAIEDAANRARTIEDESDYYGNTGSEYPADIIVDKDSILNLKK